jgi:hypothetical protein
METIEAKPKGPYRLSVAEREGIARGLRELRERSFASDEAVAEVFRRARCPGQVSISPSGWRSDTLPS